MEAMDGARWLPSGKPCGIRSNALPRVPALIGAGVANEIAAATDLDARVYMMLASLFVVFKRHCLCLSVQSLVLRKSIGGVMKIASCKRVCSTMIGIVLVLCYFRPAAHAQTLLTPPWLTWLGNGTHNQSCLSGDCVINDEVWFASYTLASGATLFNTAGNGSIIIRATGTCTIAGTINTSPNVPGQTGITGDGDFGGGGGGGGGGTHAGNAGNNTQVIPNIPIVNGGAGGKAGGGNGQAGKSTTTVQYQMFLSNGSDWPGGGAIGGRGASSGGAAGQGGAPVIIVCNTINFTGTINVSGGNGGNAPASNTGAGGGGGGGYVVLAAKTYTADTGTIITNGGAGGSCNGYANCGTGGSGGNGWSAAITIQ